MPGSLGRVTCSHIGSRPAFSRGTLVAGREGVDARYILLTVSPPEQLASQDCWLMGRPENVTASMPPEDHLPHSIALPGGNGRGPDILILSKCRRNGLGYVLQRGKNAAGASSQEVPQEIVGRNRSLVTGRQKG